MVSFIGAGPGDPELLTIKGKKIIDSADVIIYAGSLVNPQVLAGAKEGAVIYNSATMHLDEVIDVMKDAESKGLKVARVHTGDPAIYGAHREQMDRLDELGIEYEVIPGVQLFPGNCSSIEERVHTSGCEPDCDPDPYGRPYAYAAEGETDRSGTAQCDHDHFLKCRYAG